MASSTKVVRPIRDTNGNESNTYNFCTIGQPYSSLPFQIMITVSETYLPAMFLVTLGSLIYKGALLPYPPVILVLEMALVLLLPLMESSRLFFACRANLTESFPSLLLFFGMTLILPVMSVFFMAWQTYVCVYISLSFYAVD
ncbi:hypothetical protein BC828DRAFT_278387 [Blastocladiella britannica]|nr:hypothetical protein BC828DRAFT_278387 [Blastocladiella britannica]